MTNKDIRWKQRFQNFEKAFFRLKEALEEEDQHEQLSHDYSGEKFEKSEDEIRKLIFPAIEKVYLFFCAHLSKDQEHIGVPFYSN